MELERREDVRVRLQRFREIVPVVADGLCPSRLDFRDDREPITRRRLGIDWTVFPLFEVIGLLWYHDCCWFDLHLNCPFLGWVGTTSAELINLPLLQSIQASLLASLDLYQSDSRLVFRNH